MILATLPLFVVAYLYAGAVWTVFNRLTARVLSSTLGAAVSGYCRTQRGILAFAGTSVPANGQESIPETVCPSERTESPLLGKPIKTAPMASALPTDPDEAAQTILANIPESARLALAWQLRPTLGVAWAQASSSERASLLAAVGTVHEASHPLDGLPAMSEALAPEMRSHGEIDWSCEVRPQAEREAEEADANGTLPETVKGLYVADGTSKRPHAKRAARPGDVGPFYVKGKRGRYVLADSSECPTVSGVA